MRGPGECAVHRARRWWWPTIPGSLPLDAIMLQTGLHDEHPAHRNLRLLGADLVYELPVPVLPGPQAGHTRACPANADGCCSTASWSACSPRGSRASASRSATGTSCAGSAAAGSRSPRCAPGCRSSRARSSAPRRSTRCSATPSRWPGLLRLPYFPITPAVPVAGPGRRGAAAVPVDHRVLPAGADHRLPGRAPGGTRPPSPSWPPGPRHDPGQAGRPAGRARPGVRLVSQAG